MPLSGPFLQELERIVGAAGLVRTLEGRLVYECDMHTFYKGAPDAVALPTRTEEVVEIVNLCRRERVPIVPRGSGTGLIGGAMAPVGGVMIGTNRMDAILEIDLPNRGAAVGSEGTFGIVTAVTVRLLHAAEAVKTILASFTAIEDASEAVSAIIAAGIVPAALEMLDELMIRAINEGTGAGYPKDAAAVLLIELDGPAAEVEAQGERAARICWERGALEVRVAADVAERALLWKGRKEAAGAVGRLAPTYLLQDAVVPRSKLPAIMRELIAIGARHRVQIANVFHAGDGNLHPLILYDDRVPEELERAKAANEELLLACIAMGGTVTGEHGIGLDKAKNLPFQYADADLNFMYRLRRAFDPDGIMNPGKLLPSHPACGEGFRPARPRVPDGAWI